MVYHQPTRRPRPVRRDRTLDRVFASLADPTRRAILARLATGDRTISDLASRFDMTLPAVSKHVKVLERAGLARVRRDGRSRRTFLVAAPLREARDWIETYRRFWEFHLDQLAAYLEQAVPDTPHPAEQESAPCPPGPQPRSTPSKSAGPSRPHGSASSTRGRGRRS